MFGQIPALGFFTVIFFGTDIIAFLLDVSIQVPEWPIPLEMYLKLSV